MRGLRYAITWQEHTDPNDPDSIRVFGVWRVRIEVEGAVGMPAQIFVYRRELVDEAKMNYEDVCVGVASAADLAEYPVDDPDPGLAYPFFRKTYAIFDFRSIRMGSSAIDDVEAAIENLVQALNAADVLVPGKTVQVGDEPSPGEGL
jgi:hypothetical protein